MKRGLFYPFIILLDGSSLYFLIKRMMMKGIKNIPSTGMAHKSEVRVKIIKKMVSKMTAMSQFYQSNNLIFKSGLKDLLEAMLTSF